MSAGKTEPWLLIDSGAGDAAFNMALDETLLAFAPDTQRSVLRFYGWTEQAASFGYSQKVAEIESATTLRPLVRRTTGGGLVPHDADWTYSVIIPPNHPWYELRASESYERMHRWIQSAFTALGLTTELAPCCRKEIAGQCFAGHEKSDVLRLGRKIAGAAQRRTKHGLLIQGSVQPEPNGISRSAWQSAMRTVAQRDWEAEWIEWTPPTELFENAHRLASEKYSRDGYNRRR